MLDPRAGTGDLYALSIDYDPATAETREFFQIVQNKLHWAVTGSTAAEIIAERANADKPNMGLTKPLYMRDWRVNELEKRLARE